MLNNLQQDEIQVHILTSSEVDRWGKEKAFGYQQKMDVVRLNADCRSKDNPPALLPLIKKSLAA